MKEKYLENLSKLVPSDIIRPLFTNRINIELLVKHGRTPVACGSMGSIPSKRHRKEGETLTWRPLYVVPPFYAAPQDIKDSFVDCGGAVRYVDKNGSKIDGLVYQVSQSEADKIDGIINSLKKAS